MGAVSPEKAGTRPASGDAPERRAFELAHAFVASRALHVCVQLGLPALMRDGALTSRALAKATGTHEPSLYRLMRGLTGHGCFLEGDDRTFSLGPVGLQLLPQEGKPGAAAEAMGAPQMWEAFGRLAEAVELGRPTLESTRRGRLYDPEASERAAQLVAETQLAFHGLDLEAVLLACDFSPSRLIVDVGGSSGSLLASILAMHPDARGILFDLPATARAAALRLEAMTIAGRCEVVGGNFFESVPAGGDTYILSHVLHDWSDEEALVILDNCRAAIARHGRLLVVEPVIPPGNSPHHGKLLDLILLVTTSGRERSLEEHEELLSKAGFRLKRVTATTQAVSIIEAEPA